MKPWQTLKILAQIDSAFNMLNKLGINNVKIGQVGKRLDQSEFHYGQYGVNYYRAVLEKAVQYKIGVNFHEPIKDTGERRTFPNMMTREGAKVWSITLGLEVILQIIPLYYLLPDF